MPETHTKSTAWRAAGKRTRDRPRPGRREHSLGAIAGARPLLPRLGEQGVEIASNDGYLLQYFKALGVPVLGVEPAANVAREAEAKGIPTVVKFFGAGTARDLAAGGHSADLLLGNNVLAHVPGLNDFVEGLGILLKPKGVITMEFPHLLRLMQGNQFDTIYHEHFSYFSLLSVEKILAAPGLTVFDVEELWTHGGSLRVWARPADDRTPPVGDRVRELRRREQDAGLDRIVSNKTHYPRWETRLDFLRWCEEAGFESDQTRGPSKKGTIDFPLGGSQPY